MVSIRCRMAGADTLTVFLREHVPAGGLLGGDTLHLLSNATVYAICTNHDVSMKNRAIVRFNLDTLGTTYDSHNSVRGLYLRFIANIIIERLDNLSSVHEPHLVPEPDKYLANLSFACNFEITHDSCIQRPSSG